MCAEPGGRAGRPERGPPFRGPGTCPWPRAAAAEGTPRLHGGRTPALSGASRVAAPTQAVPVSRAPAGGSGPLPRGRRATPPVGSRSRSAGPATSPRRAQPDAGGAAGPAGRCCRGAAAVVRVTGEPVAGRAWCAPRARRESLASSEVTWLAGFPTCCARVSVPVVPAGAQETPAEGFTARGRGAGPARLLKASA